MRASSRQARHGERVEAIAQELHGSPQTVRRRLHRFDAEGIEGLGDRPKPGRPRRLTTEDDSRLIALVRQAPPGRLVTQRDGTMVARKVEGEAQWSLNALARAATDAGIVVKRSQIRRILLREGVGFRHSYSWATPRDDDHLALCASAPAPRLHSHRSLLAERGPEGWWRLFRRDALAGQSFANPREIEQATRVAMAQLNRRAKPWVWGRPRHQITAAIADSFVTVFNELSIRSSLSKILQTLPLRLRNVGTACISRNMLK